MHCQLPEGVAYGTTTVEARIVEGAAGASGSTGLAAFIAYCHMPTPCLNAFWHSDPYTFLHHYQYP